MTDQQLDELDTILRSRARVELPIHVSLDTILQEYQHRKERQRPGRPWKKVLVGSGAVIGLGAVSTYTFAGGQLDNLITGYFHADSNYKGSYGYGVGPEGSEGPFKVPSKSDVTVSSLSEFRQYVKFPDAPVLEYNGLNLLRQGISISEYDNTDYLDYIMYGDLGQRTFVKLFVWHNPQVPIHVFGVSNEKTEEEVPLNGRMAKFLYFKNTTGPQIQSQFLLWTRGEWTCVLSISGIDVTESKDVIMAMAERIDATGN